MGRISMAFSLAVMVLVSASAAMGQTSYELDGESLLIVAADGTEHGVALPCTGLALAVAEESLFVACGEAGLLTLTLENPIEPEVIGFRDFDGVVTNLFSVDGQVWVEIASVEARPLSAGARMTYTDRVNIAAATHGVEQADAPIVPPPEPTVGSVLQTSSAGAVIDLGTESGLARNDRIEFFRETAVNLGDGEAGIRETRLAVGRAAAVSDHRAEVALGLNERVPLGALARPTELELTSSNWSPPRVGGIWDIGFMFRPFLSLGTLGVGMVSQVEIGYRWERPVAVELILDPVGLGIAEEGNVVSLAGNLIASYDTESFQIGLGLGWSAVNDELSGGALESADRAGGIDLDFERVRSGLSIAQIARLGSRDGLNIRAFNTFILYDSEFVYGGTNGLIQVPLGTESRPMWLIFQSGGGRAGYIFGEVALRVLLVGNGGSGSLFVTPSIGGGYLSGEEDEACEVYDYSTGTMVPGTCTNNIDYGGPMVGFGATWRL